MSEDVLQNIVSQLKNHASGYLPKFASGDLDENCYNMHVISKFSLILEQFGFLLRKVILNDTLLLQLSTICLNIFFVGATLNCCDSSGNVVALSHSSNKCLTSLFTKYATLRSVVLEDFIR